MWASAWAYWPPHAGPATSCSTGRSGGACRAPRARRRARRWVPAGYFGIFMSVNPVLAALIGLVILRQSLSWEAWLSIAAIVAANAAAAAIRLHGEDHGRADDGRARDPGRAQPLAEQQGRQDGSGQRFEQGQPGGRARRGGPQTAEEQRVGHGGRA